MLLHTLRLTQLIEAILQTIEQQIRIVLLFASFSGGFECFQQTVMVSDGNRLWIDKQKIIANFKGEEFKLIILK